MMKIKAIQILIKTFYKLKIVKSNIELIIQVLIHGVTIIHMKMILCQNVQ